MKSAHAGQLLLWCMLAAGLTGCAASRAPIATYTPTFDYVPPSTAAAGSAGVSLAIVQPHYGSAEMSRITVGPLARFPRSMAGDFEEMLTAKGFTVRGPYESYDMMTFPDREACDLTLQPQLEITGRTANVTTEKKLVIMGPDRIAYKGQVSVGGRVTLSINESISNERMWVRSIEVTERTGDFQTSWYPEGTSLEAVPDDDPGVADALGKILDDVYVQIAETAWRFIDPREMVVVKEQSLEPRSRWVSGRRP